MRRRTAASVEASERYLAGVMPVLFLNAVQKTLSQENPVRKQISLTDNAVVFRRYLAVVMRILRTYSWGVKPVWFLNTRIK